MDADEVLPETRMRAITSMWQTLLRSGWVARNSTAAVARWIADNSYVEGTYAAKDIVKTLGVFGLLKVDDMANTAARVEFTNFTLDACFRVMPTFRGPLTSARVCSFRDVFMPPKSQSAFIGKNGSNIRRTEQALTARLADLGRSGSVRLRVQAGAVRVHLELVPGPDAAATDPKQVLDSLVAEVKLGLEQSYSLRLQRSYRRRAALQERRQKEGRQYQATVRLQRSIRRELPGAARALALPDAGVDGVGEVTIRRAGCGRSACATGRRLMKQRHQLSRRMALKQKRCELSRLGAVCADGATGDVAWQAGRRGTRRMQACQQLLNSAHLAKALQLSPRITGVLQSRRGAVRRLRRHFMELVTAAGQFVPDVSLPRVAQSKQNMQLRRERKSGRGMSSELAAVRDMLD